MKGKIEYSLFLGVCGLTMLISLTSILGIKNTYDNKIDALEQNIAVMQSADYTVAGNTHIASIASIHENLSVPDIVQKASGSVVGIKITAQIRTNMGRFGAQTLEQSSGGSGIISTTDGYIITNYHVVENIAINNAGQIEIFLADGRSTTANYIGGDEQNDLAVLKIDLDNLPVAQFGTSETLRVGEFAMAIGNPLGMDLAGTVTVGIISGIDRKVEVENVADSLIQTDAAINPGNSGGALVNKDGEVIGINTIKIASTGIEGIGFAIPTDYALPIIKSIIENGYVKGRPATGISGTEINAMTARFYNVPAGLLVTDVGSGSAAEAAGIQRNDIILELDSKAITSVSSINTVLKQHKIGDEIPVTFYRNGQTLTVILRLMDGN